MDHFHQVDALGGADLPMLEAFTTLAGIASVTTRIRIAPLVAGVTYRNPALVAKTVTTLDQISSGRAMLGLGAAWFEREHNAYGFDFPPVRERMDRLEEALAICQLMLTQPVATFEGRHYNVRGAVNIPPPVQPGGIPIIVGGSGERRTLRIVARYADLSHWSGPLADLRRKTELLLKYCEEVGRDPASIRRMVAAPIALVATEAEAADAAARMSADKLAVARPATVEQAVDIINEHMAAGFTGFTLRGSAHPTAESIDLAGHLIARFR
jgi:F420-dependent oxidoreductase-like protein